MHYYSQTKQAVEETFNRVIEYYGLYEYEHRAKLSQIMNNPYHNDYHTRCVVVNCAEGASFCGLSYDATVDLLTAALFHDSMHSGGYHNDDKNISDAISCFASDHGHLTFSSKIAKFIRATKYPFEPELVPYPVEVQILRDADIMQSLMPEWESMYKGLQLEVSYQQRKLISDKGWYDGTVDFYNNAELFTDWAIAKIRCFRDKVGVSSVGSKKYHYGWLDWNMENQQIAESE